MNLKKLVRDFRDIVLVLVFIVGIFLVPTLFVTLLEWVTRHIPILHHAVHNVTAQ